LAGVATRHLEWSGFALDRTVSSRLSRNIRRHLDVKWSFTTEIDQF